METTNNQPDWGSKSTSVSTVPDMFQVGKSMLQFLREFDFCFSPWVWLTSVSPVAGKMDTDPQGHPNILAE